TLTDFMPALSPAEQRQVLQPEHELLRILSCPRGEVEVEIVFDPRPDYGRARPRIENLGKLGLRASVGRSRLLTLLSDAPLDAGLTSRALFGLGHREEAENFISWLLTATNLSLPRLHVLYDLFGRQPRPERELTHLSGHRGSRPVRVGNAAMGQVQLDTYGEV